MNDDETPMPMHRAFLWLGVPIAVVGLYFATTDAPLGWVFVVLGGMLFFAGLIGEAVRGFGVQRERNKPRRPWDGR